MRTVVELLASQFTVLNLCFCLQLLWLVAYLLGRRKQLLDVNGASQEIQEGAFSNVVRQKLKLRPEHVFDHEPALNRLLNFLHGLQGDPKHYPAAYGKDWLLTVLCNLQATAPDRITTTTESLLSELSTFTQTTVLLGGFASTAVVTFVANAATSSNEDVSLEPRFLNALWLLGWAALSAYCCTFSCNYLATGLNRCTDDRNLLLAGRYVISKIDQVNFYFYQAALITLVSLVWLSVCMGRDDLVEEGRKESRSGQFYQYLCTLSMTMAPLAWQFFGHQFGALQVACREGWGSALYDAAYVMAACIALLSIMVALPYNHTSSWVAVFFIELLVLVSLGVKFINMEGARFRNVNALGLWAPVWVAMNEADEQNEVEIGAEVDSTNQSQSDIGADADDSFGHK